LSRHFTVCQTGREGNTTRVPGVEECAAQWGLRAAGIEVWLDQSELRSGDAWKCEPTNAANRQPGAVSGLRLLPALQLH
jgi:hypothetical protein